MLVDALAPPPVPVTVMEYVPAAALPLTASVRVADPEPGAGMLAGVKVAVTPEGTLLAASDTAALNPPAIVLVMVKFPGPPGAILTEAGLADREKPGVTPGPIVRLIVALGCKPPPVPLMVTV